MNQIKILSLVSLITLTNCFTYSQGYVELANLIASDAFKDDRFGHAVDHDASQLIVGATNHDRDENGANPNNNTGAVYIFTLGSPIPQKIVASDRANSDSFGYSVAIEGDYAVVGMSNYIPSVDSKKSYIFKKNSSGIWEEIQILVMPEGKSFGHAVEIQDGTIVVGDPNHALDASNANPLPNAGAIFVYDMDASGTYVLTEKVLPSIRFEDTNFGHSLSKHNDRIIVGAKLDDWDETNSSFGSDAGSGYIFHRNSAGLWDEQQKIVASDRIANQWYGEDVALFGDFAAIGAPREKRDEDGLNPISEAGATYLYHYDSATNSWNEIQKIVAANRTFHQRLGWSIDMADGLLAMGAPSGNDQFIEIYKDVGFGSWSYLQMLEPSDGLAGDFFGWSVSATETFIMGGAQKNHIIDYSGSPQADAGSVYAFYNFPCDLPTITNVELEVDCSTGMIDISIDGALNSASNSWHVYTGDCGETLIAISNDNDFSISVPSGTTAIFIRGEDGPGCVNEDIGTCFNISLPSLEDEAPPVAICQDITIFLDASGSATIAAQDIDGGSYDDCGNVNMAAGPLDFDCDDIGDNTVTLQVWDNAGNGDYCEANVTVIDNIDLVTLCKDITVSLDATGQITIDDWDVDGGTFDNCDEVFIAVAPKHFDTSDIGDNTVWLQSWTNNGVSGYCVANVHVINPFASMSNPGSEAAPTTLHNQSSVLSHSNEEMTATNTKFTIYPNPVVNEFIIAPHDNSNPIQKVEILNSRMETVESMEILHPSSRHHLHLGNQPSGVYFIAIQGHGGIEVHRIIKI